MRRRTTISCLDTRPVVLLLGCVAALGQVNPSGWRTFTSPAAGYAVSYPPDWHTFPPGNLPTLVIYNFPFSRAGGGVLPDGGAQLGLVPAPAGVTSIEGWISEDGLVSGERSRRSITLRGPGAKVAVAATEVVSSDSEGMETVSCYFGMAGRLLVGRVTYWPGDPKAALYRRLLREIIQTARPVPSR